MSKATMSKSTPRVVKRVLQGAACPQVVRPDRVMIDTPRPGDSVGPTFSATGTADTGSVVSAEVTDANGNTFPAVQETVSLPGGTDHWTFDFNLPPNAVGPLVLSVYQVEGGQASHSIPLNLVPTVQINIDTPFTKTAAGEVVFGGTVQPFNAGMILKCSLSQPGA